MYKRQENITVTAATSGTTVKSISNSNLITTADGSKIAYDSNITFTMKDGNGYKELSLSDAKTAVKAKKEVKDRTESMKSIEYFWGMGYITVILFAIIQNGAFQNDFIDFFSIPFTWYVRFCEWLIYPTYDNGFNQKIAYTGGRTWII